LGLKPGKFPIGSPQSRAAARATLQFRFDGRKKCSMVAQFPDIKEPRIGAWEEAENGNLSRRCELPVGMRLEDADPEMLTDSAKHTVLIVDI
jgi:hypothetical protein